MFVVVESKVRITQMLTLCTPSGRLVLTTAHLRGRHMWTGPAPLIKSTCNCHPRPFLISACKWSDSEDRTFVGMRSASVPSASGSGSGSTARPAIYSRAAGACGDGGLVSAPGDGSRCNCSVEVEAITSIYSTGIVSCLRLRPSVSLFIGFAYFYRRTRYSSRHHYGALTRDHQMCPDPDTFRRSIQNLRVCVSTIKFA